MDEIQQVCIWLIKKLCIDTDAIEAEYKIDMTYHGKAIGTYKIEIKKIG